MIPTIVLVFLFQTGAIRSETNWERSNYTQDCFYSKLVRLEEETAASTIVGSLLVSIPNWCDQKERVHHLFEALFHLFLFQTGAIRRRLTDLFILPHRTCFYSKLVRLEGNFLPRMSFGGYLSFYSKLVRLEEKMRSGTRLSCVTQFLFQTGAIRRLRTLIVLNRMASFYSKLVRLEVGEAHIRQTCRLVSIPNWCDQKHPIRREQDLKCQAGFYSKLVRLEGVSYDF